MQHGRGLNWVRGLLLSGVFVLGSGVEGVANRSSTKPKPQSVAASKVSAPSHRKPTPVANPASKPSGIKPAAVPPAPAAALKPVSYGASRNDGRTLNLFPSEAIEAVGVASYPANIASRAQARVLARRAAILDAQRQLVEQLYGVNIVFNSHMNERGLQEDVHASAQGVVQGAQVVAERDWGDAYEVTLRWAPPVQPSGAPPAPTPELIAPPTWVAPRPAHPQGYTGVVIDARGLGLQPSMSPCIRDAYGNILWGNMEIDPQTVIEYGLAGWARTQADLSHSALRTRLGANPLHLKAIGVQGAARNEVILSESDAERLLRENARSGFLERLAVAFLY